MSDKPCSRLPFVPEQQDRAELGQSVRAVTECPEDRFAVNGAEHHDRPPSPVGLFEGVRGPVDPVRSKASHEIEHEPVRNRKPSKVHRSSVHVRLQAGARRDDRRQQTAALVAAALVTGSTSVR